MAADKNIIKLYREDSYVTPLEHKNDAYIVLSGEVTVFVVPLKDGHTPGMRVRLCDAGPDTAIPALVYKDSDNVQWRFLIIAQEEAELELLEDFKSDFMEESFFEYAGLTTYGKEGFEKGLIDFYNEELLAGQIHIIEGENDQPANQEEARKVILKAYSEDEGINAADPMYRAAAYACRALSIPIADESCFAGKEMSVQEIARMSRFACRSIVLDPKWYASDCGTIISNIGGEPVACVPTGQSGYVLYNGTSGEVMKLTGKIADNIDPQAYCIGRTLPGKALRMKDVIRFSLGSIRKADLVMVVLLGLVGALIGILLPTLNQQIYDDYIPLGNYSQLIQLCVVIATFMIGNLFFDMVKRLSEFRIGSRVGYDLQNAVYYRVFHLPENFFREYDSADLAQRLSYVSHIANKAVSTVLVSGVATGFSLLYLFRMFKYSSKLAWIAMLLLLIYTAVAFGISTRILKHEKRIEEQKGQASSKLYQYLNGIEKIRMAGAEDKATYEYLLPFSEKQTVEIQKNRIDSISGTLSGVVTVIFSMVFYYMIVKNKLGISTGSFMGFNSAFGSFSSAILQFVSGLVGLWQLKSQYARFRPVLETAQEDDVDCELPGKLKGGVSLRNIRFSYAPEGINVLDGIDLDVKPGEYIGIVGASGCGKSTLLKLLLGFEEPKDGQVLYDGKNIKTLDKRELRKNLGVVLQNGKLISGSIYDNITITAPQATMQDINRVIEAVGLKSDIEQMPMGIHTVLSENSGTISGGQQQRILIARAIISNPAILIFDEATSALDNLTQAAVCESLDQMKVTRIVVAHRLSTIRQCDRIIVLDRGRIAEQGDYEMLMDKKGLFYSLAVRQIVDEV